MIKVFFDASVIFSAIYSESGGSRKLTDFVKLRDIVGITTQTVIEEVEDNINKFRDRKASPKQFIKDSNFIVREKIKQSETKTYAEIVNEKDRHVLAGAILTGCSYLVTLDKKHLNNPLIKIKISKIIIVSPKELLNAIA
ncbi:putative toxin-antitoxin system toxin component, PIN family [Candidatus Roizmanbacteria bacterium RIFCSPHIGHO2_01_FULL_35_10]|nr:MAG: putative toxin-antitoxin system toxin component, PIN family [Candidatus Roizmanbacteria bacterium RIFCSPHIGHO2_01_FULL_35_10]